MAKYKAATKRVLQHDEAALFYIPRNINNLVSRFNPDVEFWDK